MVIVEKSFPRGGQIKKPTSAPDKYKFGAKSVKKASSGLKKSEKQKLKKKKRKSSSNDGLVAKSAMPITRKTIQEGMLLMAFITRIEKDKLILSLPGKLKGSVKLTCISEAYTQALQKALEDQAAFSKLPNLEKLFTVGQAVYGKILGFPEGGSKFFDVSLNPKDTHSEFSHNTLNKGMLLTGAIAAWEDHGAVVDIGVANTRCFLPRCPKAAGLVVGQLVPCRIHELTKTASTANVTLSLAATENEKREVDLDIIENLQYLVPTSTVRLTILNNTLKNGLSGKILDGQFDAFINEQHLGPGKHLRDFDVGQDVLATVLYVMPLTKFVYLSLNKFVPQAKRLTEGLVLKDVTVISVHSAGVLLRLDKNSLGLLSVTHMKKMGSSRSETSLEDLQRKYDNVVKEVRIMSYDPMDGVYFCTDDPKLITETFFRLSDLAVGQVVKCRVKEPLKTHGVLVKIGQLNGFIYKVHLCKTLAKTRAGATIKARVLHLDKAKNSVHLTTLKEYMRANEDDLLLDRGSVRLGSDYLGLVTSTTPKLLYVEFFDKIVGTMRNGPEQLRPLGSTVKHRIGTVMRFNAVEVQGDRVHLSSGQQKVIHGIGELVEGTVTGVFESGIQLDVPAKKGGGTASVWVDKEFTTEFSELASAMGPSFRAGDHLTLIALNSSTYSVRDVAAYQRYPMVEKTSLTANKCLRAVVLRAEPGGLVVQVPLLDGAVSVKLPYDRVLMNDKVKAKTVLFKPNQVVYVKLTGPVSKTTKTLPLTAKLDMTYSGNGHATINYLKDYLSQLDKVLRPMLDANNFKWHVGSRVEGEVSKVLVTGREYEVQFGGSFLGNLRTDRKFALKDDVQCHIVWVDETGRIFLSSSDEQQQQQRNLDETANGSESRLTRKNDGIIVHRSKHCYVVQLRPSGHFVHVPVRLHYNDFQPAMDNRSGDCSVVVLRTLGCRMLGLFFDVYDRMVEHGGMKPLSLKRPLVLKEDCTEDRTGRDNDDENEVASGNEEEEDVAAEEPKKKRQKVEKVQTPIVFEENTAMANFWKMDFAAAQNSKSTDFDFDLEEEEGGKKKDTIKGPSETDIRNLEEALASSQNIPSSTAEFERLVLATPNNSLIWIKFMVFHLQALEVEKARTVFRRALKAINFRWQDDILNVWVAFLNLELRYGTSEGFEQAFSEALATNDQFKVTMRTIEILADSDKIALCKSKAALAMKKFKDRPQLWPKLGAAYFRMSLREEANQLVNKALTVLDKRDHLQVIVEFAKLNRANGQLDVASTLLEQILTSYPKRTDIWSFYIDMLVKEDQVDSARSILERAISQKLPAKKMKTLFKKYLEFEERFGDEQSVDHVKKIAAEYVQSQQ